MGVLDISDTKGAHQINRMFKLRSQSGRHMDFRK